MWGVSGTRPHGICFLCKGINAELFQCCITPSQAGPHTGSCPLPPAILLNVLGWFPPFPAAAPWLQLLALTTGTCEVMALSSAHHTPLQPSPALPAAKLDPPTLQSIQSIPFQTDCIALAWDVARGTKHMELQCELRYRAPEDPAWALVSAAGAGGWAGARTLPLLQAVGTGVSPCEWDSKESPEPTAGAVPAEAEASTAPVWLPPGQRHHRPGGHGAALWFPLWHAVPLPDALPAQLSLGTGLLERVEPQQELHHPRER